MGEPGEVQCVFGTRPEAEGSSSRLGPLRFITRGFKVLAFWRRRSRQSGRAQKGRRRGRGREPALASFTAAALEGMEYEELMSEDKDERISNATGMPWEQNKLRGCFPLSFLPTYLTKVAASKEHSTGTAHETQGGWAAERGHPQCLIACGSRMWGSGSWLDARSILGIRVYDFALYVDSRLAHAMSLGSQPTAHTSSWPISTSSSTMQQPSNHTHHPMALQQLMQPHPSPLRTSPSLCSGMDALEHLLLCPGVPVSVVLRAARDIPLDILQTEMRGVLERRYRRMGGSERCPQLDALLDCFSASRLPEQLVKGEAGKEAVRTGATMAFSRTPTGHLVASAFTGPNGLMEHIPPPPPTPPPITLSSFSAASSSTSGPPSAKQYTAAEPHWQSFALPTIHTPAPGINDSHTYTPTACTTLEPTADITTGMTTTVATTTTTTSTPTCTPTCTGLSVPWVAAAAGLGDWAAAAPRWGPPAASASASDCTSCRGAADVHAWGAGVACTGVNESGRVWGGKEGGVMSIVPLVASPLHEPKLSQALLDLYLGGQPVSKKAKAAAIDSLSRLCTADPNAVISPSGVYQPPPGQVLRSMGQHGGVVELQ